MNKNIIAILILLFGHITFLYGQEVPPDKGNTASFTNHLQKGHLPLNMSTGAPNISIPLFSLKSGKLSFPVSLNYGANGIRPSDVPGFFGLHWNCSAFGKIIQVAKGGPRSLSQSIINDPDNDDLNDIVNGYDSGEPDLYIVHAPGLHFQYYIKDEEFMPLNKSDVNIDILNVGSLYTKDTIIITNGKGIKYFFGLKQYITQKHHYLEPPSYDQYNITCEWYLTRIEGPYGIDYINFNYYTPEPGNYHPLSSLGYGNEVFMSCTQEDNFAPNIFKVRYSRWNFWLESIETPTKKIDFFYTKPAGYSSPYKPVTITFTGGEHDGETLVINNSEQFVKEIYIKNSADDTLSAIAFDYLVNYDKRVFLKSIRQKDLNGKALPSYKFQYIDPNNIGKVFTDNYAFYDYWGYYSPGKKLYPNGEPRGLLNKIYYPTGTYTEYIYEPNRYCFDTGENEQWYDADWKQTIDAALENPEYDNLRGGGFRVKEIRQYANGVLKKKLFDYTLDGTKSSGRLTIYPKHEISYSYNNHQRTIKSSYHNGPEQGYVAYEKITVYEGEKQQNGPNDYFGEKGKTEYFFNIKPHTVHANTDFPYPIITYPGDEAALLLKKNIFNADNKLISSNENIYNIDFTDSVKSLLVIAKKETNVGNVYSEFYKAWYSTKQKEIKKENSIHKLYSPGSNSDYTSTTTHYDYMRNGKSYLYPVSFSGIESNGDELRTELFYPSDFENEGGVYAALIAKNIRSMPVEKKIFKNNEQIAGERTLFRFENINNQQIVVPDKKQIWEGNKYKTVKRFDRYDEKARLIAHRGIDYIKHSLLYGYDNNLPVAEITNADPDYVFYTSFEEDSGGNISEGDAKTGKKAFSGGNYTVNLPPYMKDLILSYWTKSGDKWVYSEHIVRKAQYLGGYSISAPLIDEVRVYPADAFMTTYTYSPGLDITSITDANSRTEYREYDSFGRVVEIKNEDKITIQKNEYTFQNVDFELSSEASTIPLGCSVQLEIQHEPMDGNITYEWYKDTTTSLIGSEKTLSVTPSEIGSVTYFARIKVKQQLSGFKAITVDVTEHPVCINSDCWTNGWGHTYAASPEGDTLYFADIHNGCGAKDYTYELHDGSCNWVHIDEINGYMVIDRCDVLPTENPSIPCNCDTCRYVQIGMYLSGVGNPVRVFVITQKKYTGDSISPGQDED